MRLDFVKMSGAGNDFIVADNRDGLLDLTREQVAKLCHRQFGIGADGLMLLVPCASGKAEWAWQFWNSDGSDAEMCGNGARCFGRYIQKLTGAAGKTTFETAAGVITAAFHGERVTVGPTAPHGRRIGDAGLHQREVGHDQVASHTQDGHQAVLVQAVVARSLHALG